MLPFKKFENKITDRRLFVASTWTFVFALSSTLLISGLIYFSSILFAFRFVEKIGTANAQLHIELFPALVFNPLVESFVLSIFLLLLNKKIRLKALVIIIPALLLTILHSLQNLLWGFTIFWMLLIHSYVFFRNYHTGYSRALLIISLAHIMQNSVVIFLLNYV